MEERKPLRIIAVDDHDVVLRGIAEYFKAINPPVEFIQVNSGKEVLKIAAEICPEIVLMDILMPEMDGIETTIRLLKTCPSTKVIGLSATAEPGKIQAMLQAGAVGYLMKTAPIDDLMHVIFSTQAGRMTFSPELASILLDPLKRDQNPYHLTKRELQVLELVTNGLSNAQIAEKLGASRSTVGYHVSSVLTKLNVQSRLEAAKRALQENIIPKRVGVKENITK